MRIQVGHAGMWILIRQLLVRGVSVLQLLVLARILSPEDFGLFAVAMMAYAFIEAMTYFGLGHALIQKKIVNQMHLNTLFTANIVRGVLLGILVFTLSEPIAWLMNSHESAEIIAVIGLLPLIMGFHNPAMILLQKELQMKRELSFYLGGGLANLIISLCLGVQGYGAWALVAGLVSQACAQLIISYVIQSYRPSFAFSRGCFLEMFHFGKWLLASHGLKYFANNLPSWVIGHYSGMQALGLYHVAGRFSQAIGNEFTGLISNLAFPVFAKLQADKERLAAAYIRSQKIILSAAFLIFSCVIALSKPFVVIFLGNKWNGIEILMVLLSLVGAIQSIGAQAEVLKSLNAARIMAIFSLVRFLVTALLIVFFTQKWGVNGAASAMLVATSIVLIPSMIVILGKLGISGKAFIFVALPPCISFFTTSITPHLFEIYEINTVSSFIVALFVYLLIYIIQLFAIDFLLNTQILKEWNLLIGDLIFKRQ